MELGLQFQVDHFRWRGLPNAVFESLGGNEAAKARRKEILAAKEAEAKAIASAAALHGSASSSSSASLLAPGAVTDGGRGSGGAGEGGEGADKRGVGAAGAGAGGGEGDRKRGRTESWGEAAAGGGGGAGGGASVPLADSSAMLSALKRSLTGLSAPTPGSRMSALPVLTAKKAATNRTASPAPIVLGTVLWTTLPANSASS